ncbi:MAG TPA: VWA domain-containing protein [Pyrinomonadaceae bacterium]|nr:VWA domain-containing protein [Pyrinomonadaceae bacterium]
MPRQSSTKRALLIPLLLAASLFCSLLTHPSHAQQQSDDDEVVRVNTDLVVLNVTVADANGKYAHGLKKSDFKLFEDSKEQTIASFSAEETPFAAAVLLDTSGSMESRITMARSAAIRFLDGLRENDVAAVYNFDSKIEQVQEFSSSRDLAPVAFNLRAKGMTSLNDAILKAARDLSERPEKRRAIIVLSDGADNSSSASMDKALANAIAASSTIYTVDMSQQGSKDRQLGMGALRNFASKSGGRYVSTPGGQMLREAFASIVEELSNQYTLTYRPTNKARDGRWREVGVKIEKPELAARTRKGYRAPKD